MDGCGYIIQSQMVIVIVMVSTLIVIGVCGGDSMVDDCGVCDGEVQQYLVSLMLPAGCGIGVY